MTLWGGDRRIPAGNKENFLMGSVIKLPLDWYVAYSQEGEAKNIKSNIMPNTQTQEHETPSIFRPP